MAGLGKAATPQKHEQSQEPPLLMLPVPEVSVLELELDETIVVAAGGATTTLVAVPPVMAPADPVPF